MTRLMYCKLEICAGTHLFHVPSMLHGAAVNSQKSAEMRGNTMEQNATRIFSRISLPLSYYIELNI
jgi:hypothetical protein